MNRPNQEASVPDPVQQRASHQLMVTPERTTAMMQQRGGVVFAPPGFDTIQPTAAADGYQQPTAHRVVPLQAAAQPVLPGFVPLPAQAVQPRAYLAAAAAPHGFGPVHAAEATYSQQYLVAPGVYSGCALDQSAQQHPMVVLGIHPGFVPIQLEPHGLVFPGGEVSPPCWLPPHCIPFRAARPEELHAAANPPIFQCRSDASQQEQRPQERLLWQHPWEQRLRRERPHFPAAAERRRCGPAAPAPRATHAQPPLHSKTYNRPTPVHSPHRSPRCRSHDRPRREPPRSHSSADIAPSTGSGYEYRRLDDGSYLVRYCDAGIKSGWVEAEHPPGSA